LKMKSETKLKSFNFMGTFNIPIPKTNELDDEISEALDGMNDGKEVFDTIAKLARQQEREIWEKGLQDFQKKHKEEVKQAYEQGFQKGRDLQKEIDDNEAEKRKKIWIEQGRKDIIEKIKKMAEEEKEGQTFVFLSVLASELERDENG
jgi:hypothetical protein